VIHGEDSARLSLGAIAAALETERWVAIPSLFYFPP